MKIQLRQLNFDPQQLCIIVHIAMVTLVNNNLQSISHIFDRWFMSYTMFSVFSSSFSDFILTHYWLTEHQWTCLNCPEYTYLYRNVPLIRPPILYTTSSLKWGEGLYSNMHLVSSISPHTKVYASATYTSNVHVYIRTQLQKHSTQNSWYGSRVLFADITFTKLRGLPTSEKSCQFNARSITFTTTSL